jgi:hypothetical protein
MDHAIHKQAQLFPFLMQLHSLHPNDSGTYIEMVPGFVLPISRTEKEDASTH